MKFAKGERFASEYRKLVDGQTGATIHQLTNHASINHNLYFLHRSFTASDAQVVFTSYRSGQPQIYELEFPQGHILQLTEREAVHPYSACLSASGRYIYFTRDGSIVRLDRLSLGEIPLANFTEAQLGECDLSHDERWIVTAIKKGNQAGIVVARTDATEYDIVLRWPKTVIHPQFHPRDSGIIEFSSDPAPRMHLLHRKTGQVECLYEHDNDEFVVHETFLGATGDLAFTVWPFSLRRFHMRTREISTIADFNAWHITPDREGKRILSDTNHPDRGIQVVDVATGERRTVCFSKSSNQGSQWKKSRYALAEDWAEAAADQDRERKSSLSWMEMKIDTVYGPQWTHPHPSWSSDESKVIYTSDMSGHPQVYVAEIHG